MEYREMLPAILAELSENAKRVSAEELERLADIILTGKRVFVAGAGRSGFAARAFANRLMHLGLAVAFVGEPTTPAITSEDVLIIGSGSGETASLVAMARKARTIGAKIATLTIHPTATIGGLADVAVTIPGATPKSGFADTVASIQPMGSAFEQMCWLAYDAVVMILMDKMGKSEGEMFLLHANLE